MKDKYDFESVILIDEEGKELEFEVIDLLFIDDREYAVLVPFDPAEGEGSIYNGDDEGGSDGGGYEDGSDSGVEVIIMRIVENDGEITLLDIDDENERQKAADVFFEGQFGQEEE